MISGYSPETIRQLALLGASLDIDASGYSPESIRQIALSMKPNATLTLSNCDQYSPDSVKQIVLARKGNITLA